MQLHRVFQQRHTARASNLHEKSNFNIHGNIISTPIHVTYHIFFLPAAQMLVSKNNLAVTLSDATPNPSFVDYLMN
jgi:hypothetical protein